MLREPAAVLVGETVQVRRGVNIVASDGVGRLRARAEQRRAVETFLAGKLAALLGDQRDELVPEFGELRSQLGEELA